MQAALAYRQMGFSVLPLHGKTPTVPWQPYQERVASQEEIRAWAHEGLLDNIGLVCGAISGQLVVLDIDDTRTYQTLLNRFPALGRTYTVATGSGHGRHIYLRCEQLPLSQILRDPQLGRVEVRSSGTLVVAPPSRHPRTGRTYRVLIPADIACWPRLSALAPPSKNTAAPPRFPHSGSLATLVQALAGAFEASGYRRKGDWLNGPCVYPERHRHADSHPSFGFNARSGYGKCYVCGTLLARDIAAALPGSIEGSVVSERR